MTSPFQKTNFHPIEEEYSYEASVWGLRQPDGKIVINFDQNTNYGMLKQIARVIHCEVVTVKGTWTFVPATERVETANDTEGTS